MGHGELCALAFSRTANDVFLQLTWGPPSPTSLSPCSLALLHPSLQKASEPPEAEGLWGRRTCSCQGFRPQRSWLLSRFSLFFFSQLGVWASWRKAVSPKKSWNSRSSKSQFCVSMRGWTIRGVKNIFKCNQQLSGWISGLLYKKKHMPGVVNLAKNLGLLSSQAPWVNSWQLFC